MFFAAGVGAYNVAMFHLFTHAFFKALLFLGSGSVIHAFKNEQNINKMGGVWKKLPYTYSLMIVGTLALTGFPFLSGFYSKDAIIETVAEKILSQENSVNVLDANNNIVGSVKPSKIIQTVFRTGKEKS